MTRKKGVPGWTLANQKVYRLSKVKEFEKQGIPP
jgi:hypothetical protein